MPGFTKADEQRFQTEDDLRTLVRAAEVKNDKARLRRAVALAKKQMKELENVRST